MIGWIFRLIVLFVIVVFFIGLIRVFNGAKRVKQQFEQQFSGKRSKCPACDAMIAIPHASTFDCPKCGKPLVRTKNGDIRIRVN